MDDFDKRIEEMTRLENMVDKLDPETTDEEEANYPQPYSFEEETLPVYQEVESNIAGETDKEKDYVLVRNLLHGIIARGQVALEQSLRIAKESDHPRAIEVTTTAMKTLTDVGIDLLKLDQHSKIKTEGGEADSKNPSITQNNYYNNTPSTTEELLNAIEADFKDDEEDS